MEELLLEAAELIENTWVGHSPWHGNEYCTAVAIHRVAVLHNSIPKLESMFKKVGRLIPTFPGCCEIMGPSVPHWNDYHCKSGIEAAKLLREAAEL